MASEKLTRHNIGTGERSSKVKKEKNPKTTSVKVESSLAGKPTGQQHDIPIETTDLPTNVGKMQISADENENTKSERSKITREGKEEKKSSSSEYGSKEGGGGLSLEEISNFRAKAQQNSVEAIRAAEERYAKAKQIATDAKNTMVDTTKSASEHVGGKAVQAKDVAVESGKGAAGYVGNVAAEVKDKAVVAGWGTTHYTLEKVAGATKAVADVTSNVAGYTGEKAVAVKDKLSGARETVVEYAGEKLAAAKDAVVATEEKAAEYAARKKAEAQKDAQMKRVSREKEGGQYGTTESQWGLSPDEIEGFFDGEAQEQPQGGSSIFRAIGETIMEIGQTTKHFLIGQYPSQVMEQKDEPDVTQEPYGAAGKGT